MKRFAKPLRRAALAILALVLLLLVVVRFVYGGGEPYPNVNTTPAMSRDAVEVLAELDFPPGNVTSAADGRVFFNIHPFARADRFVDAFLFELVDGEPQPYPNQELQSDVMWSFGMTTDAQNRLWVTAPATLDRERTRLQAFDLATNERVYDLELEPGVGRFAQDLRITPDGRTAVLADTGAFKFTPASLCVLDIEGRTTRTVLEGHPSTQPQDWYIQTAEGPHAIGWGLITFSVGVDGLEFSPAGDYLYYATMSHDTLYRVRTDVLLDASLSAEEVAAAVETIAKKPLSDGIDVASNGSVLITDVEHGGVVEVDAAGRLRTLIALEEIVWSDGVNITSDNQILLTDSAIPGYLDQLLRPPSLERLERGRPYRLYRFPFEPRS